MQKLTRTLAMAGALAFAGVLAGCGDDVTVAPNPSITLTPPSATIQVGQTVTFSATVQGLSNKTVTWASDNQAKATVDANGKVTAVAAGSATITATASDPSVKASAVVTVNAVNKGVSKVEISPNTAILKQGEGAWKYIAGSAAFELAYVLLLGAAYVAAPLSVFYPIARGLAPVLILVIAVLALNAETSATQAVGVCAVGAGILLVRGRKPDRAGTLFGLAIAATIAGYTLIDNTGVTLADPLAYLEAVMVGPALVTAAVVAVRRGRPALRAGFRKETLLIAPLTLAPYALTLYALRLSPAAPVAAVRETSVVFVTVLAALMLKERVSPWRAAGAAVVVMGVILLVV